MDCWKLSKLALIPSKSWRVRPNCLAAATASDIAIILNPKLALITPVIFPASSNILFISKLKSACLLILKVKSASLFICNGNFKISLL